MKIGIIGQEDMIAGFRGVGVEPLVANTAEDALQIIRGIIRAATAEYGVLFLSEELAMQIPDDDMKKISSHTLPAVLLIPGLKGSTGFGSQKMKLALQRAVGSDILN